MLILKPNCELCDKDLPADALDARICTYECTFCADCVDKALSNVCPNCGGGFCPRPIRPSNSHRTGVSLDHHPASTKRVTTAYSELEIRNFCNSIKHLDPSQR